MYHRHTKQIKLNFNFSQLELRRASVVFKLLSHWFFLCTHLNFLLQNDKTSLMETLMRLRVVSSPKNDSFVTVLSSLIADVSRSEAGLEPCGFQRHVANLSGPVSPVVPQPAVNRLSWDALLCRQRLRGARLQRRSSRRQPNEENHGPVRPGSHLLAVGRAAV